MDHTEPRQASAKVVPLRNPRGNLSSSATRAPIPGIVTRTRDRLKYFPPNELRQRKIVGWATGLLTLLFISFACYGGLARCSFTPLPFGSDLLIDAAMVLFPAAWFLGVLHNLIIAGIFAMFLIGVSTGHVEVPGDPRQRQFIVWRRQARFAHPKLGTFVVLFGIGIWLQCKHYPLLAALVESPALALCVSACAHLWLPIARQYLVVESDEEREGLGNRLTIGGGLHGVRHGTTVIPHERLIDVQKTATIWEWCFGLAGLRIHYFDVHGGRAMLLIRALGSAALTQFIEAYLKGPFKVARTHDALKYPAGYPLRAPAPPAKPK